nr:PREDICTED: uncharacterized protein LOC108951938 [Musa acuminata subsp. malaccensis]
MIISSLGDRNAELHGQVKELKAGAGPEVMAATEQRVINLEGEVARLRSELEGIGQQQASLREQLKESRDWVRSMESELLGLSRSLEEAHLSATKAEEALVEETRVAPAKTKRAIEEYKESLRFQLRLQRLGQVLYEYGYRVIVSRFRDRFPDLYFDVDPFSCHPEDEDVEMPVVVPFDDSVDTLGA